MPQLLARSEVDWKYVLPLPNLWISFHLICALVLFWLLPRVVALVLTVPALVGAFLLVSWLLPQWPPLWHPLLGSRFGPCHHWSDYRLGVPCALLSSCTHLLLAPSPCLFILLLLWGLFVVFFVLIGQCISCTIVLVIPLPLI
jgi:hypothetical protein